MTLATAHFLAGLHALCHRRWLTDHELAQLDERGGALTPEFWRETKAMLKSFDQAPGPTDLNLGFTSLVLMWLGLSDEAAFAERYGGVGVDEAFARDRGLTAVLAHVLEGGQGQPHEAYALPLSHAWSGRAVRLMDQLPDTGSLVISTLERAIDGSPWDPQRLRPLFEGIVHVADLIGDEKSLSTARRMLETIDREAAPSECDTFLVTASAQLLTALWLITREGHLLETERGLASGIQPTPETWDKAVLAAREGRVDDIPVPLRLVREWGAPEELTEEAARRCLGDTAPLLPDIVAEIERVWGGGVGNDVTEEVARAVASVVVIRHIHLQGEYHPPPGEKGSVWFEAHQGARRPETMERASVLRQVRAVLIRCETDPLALALAYIDSAQENHALGAHDETRADLAEAMHWGAQYKGEAARRDQAATCVAQYIWLAGDPDAAMHRLRALAGEHAAKLLRDLEAREPSREALRVAEAEHRQRGDVESWCEVAVAHLLAGHHVTAEQTAREICEQHPHSALAWHTHGSVLFELGRYRDTVAPARRALALDPDNTSSRAFFARVLGRIGPDGQAEAGELAITVIEAADAEEAVPPRILCELVVVAWYAGTDLARIRRADDLMREIGTRREAPPEWLGAAVARRFHGVVSEDGPAWLARLAEAGRDSPVEIARFVVERVEALSWSETLIERSVRAAFEKAREDGCPPSITAEHLHRAARIKAREKAVGRALRAAVEFGYTEPDPDDAYTPSEFEIASALAWQPNFEQVVASFGDEPVIRLRASQLAQAACFAPSGVGPDDLLNIQETFSSERVAWVRWIAEGEVLKGLAEASGLSPATRVRLQTFLKLAKADDDEEIRGAVWVTRWHEAEQS